MQVRDRTLPKSDYKGRMTDASEKHCPCMPCYNAHNCGKPRPVYKNGIHTTNDYSIKPGDMQCATRHNKGCPVEKSEPKHIYSSDKGKKCLRCGEYRK